MSYTPTNWNTGDTITAAAMNKIENGIADAGGGGGYDFVITVGWDGNDWVNLTLESGSYSALVSKLQNGEIPSGALYIDNDGNGTRIGFLTSIIDLSAGNNIVAVAFIAYSPIDNSISLLAFVINSDNSVDPD